MQKTNLLKMVEDLCWEVCVDEGFVMQFEADEILEILKEDGKYLTNKEITQIKNMDFNNIFLTCEMKNEFELGGRLDNC